MVERNIPNVQVRVRFPYPAFGAAPLQGEIAKLVRPEGVAINSVPMMIVGGLLIVEEMIRDYCPTQPASLVTKIGLVAVFVGMCLFW